MKKLLLSVAWLWLLNTSLCLGQYYATSSSGVSITYPATLQATTTVTPTQVITRQGTAASDAYAARHHYIFQRLDRSPITTGLLSDFGAEFADLNLYTGTLTGTNKLDLNTWLSLYGTLYSSRISPAIPAAKLDVQGNINVGSNAGGAANVNAFSLEIGGAT